jgi:hypothetical protein
MSELTLETDGVRLAVATNRPDVDVWAVARACFDACGDPPNDYSSHHPCKKGGNVRKGVSKAQQVRDVVEPVLADGKAHTREELAGLVRAAGLDQRHINAALDGRYDKRTNVYGKPVYQDTSVEPAAHVAVPNADKPPWLQDPPAAKGTPQVVGSMGANGHG